MGKQFLVKKLVESQEIQESYDAKNYYEAVMKCRAYLEGWLLEYIYAILYPTDALGTKENRALVESRFDGMYMMMNWLLKQGHITQNEQENLNKVRQFCEKVIHKGDVHKVASMDVLDKYIEVTVHYCQKYKLLTHSLIEKATGQKIKL